MRTIIVSDAHVGSPEANIIAFGKFLNWVEMEEWERIILLGDTWDLWQKSSKEIKEDHAEIVGRINKWVTTGSMQVVMVLGNHEDTYSKDPVLLPQVIPVLNVDMFINEERSVLLHGNQFDTKLRRYLQRIDDFLNCVLQRYIGWSYKNVANKMGVYDPAISNLREQAKNTYFTLGFKNIFVGHTHWPEISQDDRGKFINVGDWKKHNSYVELVDGGIALKYFKE